MRNQNQDSLLCVKLVGWLRVSSLSHEKELLFLYPNEKGEICLFLFLMNGVFWQKYWAWTLIFTLLPLHWEPSYSVVLVVLEVVSESLVEVSGKGTILLVNVGPLPSNIVVSSCVTLFHWWVGTSCAS